MHLFIDILRNSILITGLVVVMMMIESLNIESKGLVFKGLKRTRLGQVVLGSLLGSIPGCMGGFATVSLYTHRMLSFGALVAMMIASSGDESFIMLAMIPEQALVLFVILFVIAIFTGYVTDLIWDRRHKKSCDKHEHHECGAEVSCSDGYSIHHEDVSSRPEDLLDMTSACHSERSASAVKRSPERHYGWKRITMFVGLAIFIAALASGNLGHDHNAHASQTGHIHTEACEHSHDHSHHHGHNHNHHHNDAQVSKGSFQINLLSEDWMNVLFAVLSLIVLAVLLLGSDHFVEDHLWKHIIVKHLPTIFAWTFGVLLVLGISLQYIEIDKWISDNTALMIILATLIGIIPESGPHMIFVTLFAAGAVPFPVLLASSISQDGHASIPLLAESKKSFAVAKLINCAVALAAGFAAMLLM